MDTDPGYRSDATLRGAKTKRPLIKATRDAHVPREDELRGEAFVGCCSTCGAQKEYHCAHCDVCFCAVCDEDAVCVA